MDYNLRVSFNNQPMKLVLDRNLEASQEACELSYVIRVFPQETRNEV